LNVPIAIRLSMLLLSALPATTACNRSQAETARAAPAPADGAIAVRPIVVTVAAAQSRPVQRTVETSGSVLAADEVQAKSEQPGTIARLRVDLGDRVEAGAILGDYDRREFQLAVDQGQADLAAAQQALARAQATAVASEAALRRTRDSRPVLEAEVARTQSQFEFMRSEMERTQQLHKRELIAAREVDNARNQLNIAAAQAARRPRLPGAGTGCSRRRSRSRPWRPRRPGLRHRWVVVLVSIGILVWGWFLLTSSRLEFVVDDDMSEFEVVAEAPPGSSLERTGEIVAGMEAAIRQIPEVATLFSTAGVRGQFQSNVSDISIYVGLTHISQRRRSQNAIKQDVRERLAAFPGTRVSVQQINLISGGGFRQTPFNLTLRGPDLDRLEHYAKAVIRELAAKPGFVDIDTAQANRQPEVQVQIERHRASDLGVRVDAVASTLRTMVGGEKVGFFRELGEQYDVRLRLQEDFRARPDTLAQLYVPARDGLVKLSNLATLQNGTSPGQIERLAQERSITIISNLYELPLADSFREAYAAVRKQQMPPEYGIVTSGRGKLLQESIQNFLIALVLSLAFIYIVLAAQFESFIHPITIMVSMFLAIPFGLFTLKVAYWAGIPTATLNIYSIMGLFLLMGVVKKNAILQVDYTNVLRARGLPRHEAQMQADRARLRPILMTTLAIIAGMLPVALGRGDGAASRASLALVVVGGQALCLIVTLVVTPVIYSMFDDIGRLRAFSRIRFPRLRAAWAARRPRSLRPADSPVQQ
jgi:multidrug efflux pump subunit AcrA (membrane-fusion protein)